MSLAHQRPKQPDRVRTQLLDVVQTLVATEGPQAVTLDAVARQAGVSKGGLQHHFPSKQALLEALSDRLFEDFQQRFDTLLQAEPGTRGRHARAYIRTAFDSAQGPAAAEMQRVIGLLSLTLPSCAERWGAMVREALAADGADARTATRLLAGRLAADGFWFSQLHDVYGIGPARQADLLQLLLALCDADTP